MLKESLKWFSLLEYIPGSFLCLKLLCTEFVFALQFLIFNSWTMHSLTSINARLFAVFKPQLCMRVECELDETIFREIRRCSIHVSVRATSSCSNWLIAINLWRSCNQEDEWNRKCGVFTFLSLNSIVVSFAMYNNNNIIFWTEKICNH